MKILQVTPFFKPLWESGGGQVAYDISRNLHENGHEITVYTTNRSIYQMIADELSDMCRR